ncbi:MarR family winged helix-turn-helix transcriptional regulator [Acinetobacter pragensis]|uniref:HTH marR-type domain-containing protein n=1 Tax=Acinetobacter pragensis TaxID=1806892 RepID=A0A151Y3X2_9GAMM|nr:MarR family transcriptional regulator [Acinetobacter pragensis]KYQ72733.1 hypothetical protein AZH43_07700 [Acinetobacter pragensis]
MKSLSNIDDNSENTIPQLDGIPTLIRENHRLLAKAFQDFMGDSTMQVADWYVMRALHEQDGLMQRDVAQRIGIMDAHTGVVIRRLEALGLVKRESDKKDMRKQCVFLTDAGRKCEQSLRSVAHRVDGIALIGLSSEEIEALHILLSRIRHNLSNNENFITLNN